MKKKAESISGREVDKYSFTHEGKELNYEIQKPTFDQLTASLSQIKQDGKMDVIGAGKVIWELCCTAFDPEIESNARILVSVCIELANTYALPIDIEIKKK
jgi:hypothetical protein